MSQRRAAIDAAQACLRRVAESSANQAHLRTNSVAVGIQLDELHSHLQALIEALPEHARDIRVHVRTVHGWQGDIDMAITLEAEASMTEKMDAWRSLWIRLEREVEGLRGYLAGLALDTFDARAGRRDVISLPIERRDDTG